ncbi:MAG: transglutaminase family protein [Candidatus Acidiferrales bacterium]
MRRRDFLKSAGVVSAGLAWSNARELFAESGAGWRMFEITTRVEILKPSGTTRVWLPAALIQKTPYQRTLSNKYHAQSGQAGMSELKPDALGIVSATFAAGPAPVLTLTSRVQTRNHSVDLSRPGNASQASRGELEYFLRPTKLLPSDGVVKATAAEITKNANTDVEKAKAIYEWIVDKTFRDPKTKGCGLGDIRFMLETGDLGGKCADLNALFVGLAHAAGLPARDAYGIRVAKSDLGYKSLGASSDNITKSQHCRAEVYLNTYGWVPVDPADVRKVVLEEPPGNRPMNDEMVTRARARLFGSWEMNWIAYNFAHDVVLPGGTGATLPFLMYPQAQTADGRLDSLDAANFKYEITSNELTPTKA